MRPMTAYLPLARRVAGAAPEQVNKQPPAIAGSYFGLICLLSLMRGTSNSVSGNCLGGGNEGRIDKRGCVGNARN